MFLIKNCAQVLMALTNFLISENKNTHYVHYINKDCESITTFMKITSNATHDRQKRQKAQNDKKLVF